MDQSKTRKRLSREEKLRDQKIEEEVMKVIDDGKSPEEKLQLLVKHCIDRERNNRRLIVDLKYQFKQLENVEREKDNLQKDCSRNVLMRDKLTEVCREQQKIIKSLKNESTQKIREEEEKRKELQSKFNDCLGEITQSLTKNNEENVKLQALNLEMNKKLKTLFEQYNVREQQLEKLGEQMQLESQLHQAKINKLQVESVMEREVLMKEKELALEQLLHAQKVVKEMFEREASLKEQLSLYTDKYDDIKDALRKSNDVFVKYKHDMEEMTKYIRKLEKDASEWRRKWQQSNATIISLATEKVERDEQSLLHNRQIEQLRKLLRALQNERGHLYGVLKEHNIDVPPVPQLPTTDIEPEVEPLPVAVHSSSDTNAAGSTMNRKNYVELKKTLAYLQQQMKQLSTQPAEVEEVAENSSVSSVGVGRGPISNCKMSALKKMKKKDKKKVTISPSLSASVPNGDANGTVEGDQRDNNTISLENNGGEEFKKKCKKSKIKSKNKTNMTNGSCGEESITTAPIDDESNLSDNDTINNKTEENQCVDMKEHLNGNKELLENQLLPLDPVEDDENLTKSGIKETQLEETQLEEVSLEKIELKKVPVKTELLQDIEFPATIAQEVEVLAVHLAESCLEENICQDEQNQTLQTTENIDSETKLNMPSIEITNTI